MREQLVRTIRESVRVALGEGIPLELFLATQWANMPATVDADARILVFGLAVSEWFTQQQRANVRGLDS